MNGKPQTFTDSQGRVCTNCNEYLPWDSYESRGNHLNGVSARQSVCKLCRKLSVNEANTNQRRKYKREAVAAYGGLCACCGEDELVFLTIDHPKGDGAAHRRRLGNRGGLAFYLWLRRNNFPAGYQVLCWNCNSAKHINGVCPHQIKR